MSISEVILQKMSTCCGEEEPTAMPEEISAMIDVNPFSERIRFLLKNERLVYLPVECKPGHLCHPNCIGTTLFIAGLGKFDYPYFGYNDELDEHLKRPTLDLNNLIPGVFCFSWSNDIEDWHAGIYLGTLMGEQVMFAKHGYAGSFGPEFSSLNYDNPKYYLPRNLET